MFCITPIYHVQKQNSWIDTIQRHSSPESLVTRLLLLLAPSRLAFAFRKCPRFTKPRDFKETVIIQRTLTHQRQKPPCEKHHEKGKYRCGRVYYLGWFEIAPVQKWNHRERHRSAHHVLKTSTCGRFFSSKTCLAIEYQRISLTTQLFN